MALGKKVNELVPYDDAAVAVGDLLVPMADPITGICGYGTIAQLAGGISGAITTVKYVADGTEGTTLSIPVLSGKQILMASREAAIMYETDAAPDSTEYIWNLSTVELGSATNPGERFKFVYVNA